MILGILLYLFHFGNTIRFTGAGSVPLLQDTVLGTSFICFRLIFTAKYERGRINVRLVFVPANPALSRDLRTRVCPV